ncbi:MAG: multidrug ABC transporter ATP-binding protein [Alphaproteobacteria bacterium RIFCSPHIGHO2_12_FULL_63_12]|nr:MAG: multidrug ABC transporter ATP-binding protein [Alphaproteobacteria bacterium RIFCSPHIGHO2_12_FULL_63_12]
MSVKEAAIAAKGLRKIYAPTRKAPAKEALKSVDLDIPVGSIFGLLGPNGAGKSTFINILAGLVTKTEGSVSIWGFDIDKNPRQARASIGVVPQEINMDVFFTPKEALDIQAGLYGVPKSERRTMEILSALGLEDKANAYVRMLSGGMKRRLLVAKAMVHAPPILILDEPTAGVDIELRKQLWDYVLTLHAQGVTIVLTTHYLEEAQELCDRIAIIHQGEVVACEPTEKLVGSLDSKMLLVTPAEPLAAPPDLHPYTAELKSGGKIAIPYQPSSCEVSSIIERLQAAGVRIKDMTTVEADLEDVFLALTYDRDRQPKDKLRQAAPAGTP